MKKILLSLCILLSSVAFAAKPITPEPADAAKVGAVFVTVEEAKALFEQGAVFVDTRKPIEVSKQKIKGAVRGYYNEKGGNKNKKADWDASKDIFQTENLPADKSKVLVAYCNGSKCWKSFKTAVTLTKMGYTNAKWMREGIPAWSKAGYPVE